MATHSDLVNLNEDGELFHEPHESYESQGRPEAREAHLLSPSPRAREPREPARGISFHHLQDDEGEPSRPELDIAAANNEFVSIPDSGSDAFDANTLAHLQVLRKHPPLEVEQEMMSPNKHPLYHRGGPAGPDITEITHDVDNHDEEGATAGAVYHDIPGIPYENDAQGFREAQTVGNVVNMVAAEHGIQWPEEEPKQIPPPGKRKKRKLRRKLLPEAINAQPGTRNEDAALASNAHAMAYDDYLPHHGATHMQIEHGISDGLRPHQHQKQKHDIRPDSPHFQLQNEMEAAAVDDGVYFRGDNDSPDKNVENERLEQHDQQTAPTMHHQYFQPQHSRYGAHEMGQDYTGDVRPGQCPSSDILGDAAQEFEHRIYRKQQAKSAKHQAERSAWQNDLRQELQAKQMLQDRLDVLQHEKDELAAAIEKQKAKVAGFEAMANKLKTFIGGLANDMGALKRDASAHRQNCRDIGEETKEHKAMLDVLLQQLFTNAEKSSKLKNEAIKACLRAKAELSTVTMRAIQLEEQLNEKSTLLAEEKSLRKQFQSQLSSAANSGDTMLRLLKSSEQSVLNKLAEVAASVAEPENGEGISEQLSKILEAVQGPNSQQTATVNEIVSVKGVIDRLSESLNKRTDDAQHQTDQESFLKTYIDEALKILKSDLCQQEKLAVQDATNREAISGLRQKIEDVNARMSECDSSLSTTRANEARLKEQNVLLEANIATLQSQAVPGERDSAQLSQLKAELGLKVTALQTTKSELDVKANDLLKLTATNAELQSQIDALDLRLKAAPTAIGFEIERTKLEEKHREEIERVKIETKALTNTYTSQEKAEAANALKNVKYDQEKTREKFEATNKELASSKKQIDELQTKYASEVFSMQKKIKSTEDVVADREKRFDSLRSDLEKAQKATKEVDSLKTQFTAKEEAIRKAIQEKDSLVKQIQDLRREFEKREERLNLELQQCHTGNKEMKRRMKTDVRAAEERGKKETEEMEESAQKAIEAEKANHVKQVQALQQSLHKSQIDLQNRTETDEEFREELQRSWQTEEKKNQGVVTELSGKILEAEMQRDQAIADNERLREDLAMARTPMISKPAAEISKTSFQPLEPAGSSDPRLQNRRPQPGNGIALRDKTEISQVSRAKKKNDRTVQTAIGPAAAHGTKVLHSSAPPRGPAVEESQQEPPPTFSDSHNRSEQTPQEDQSQGQKSRGPLVEESQPPSYSAFGDSPAGSAHQQTEEVRGPVVEESQQQLYSASSQLQSKKYGRRDQFGEQYQHQPFSHSNAYSNITSPISAVEDMEHSQQNAVPPHHRDASRGPIVEESQQDVFASSQARGTHRQGQLFQRQISSVRQGAGWLSRTHQESAAETQFVPETQYEPDMRVERPSFANFNAASTMRNGKEHDATSTAFDNPPNFTSKQVQCNAPRHFQKSMPPPNTATRMVRTGTDTSSLSSLSSLSQEEAMPASRMALKAATKHKTPESRPLGGKAQHTQSVISGSSPGFVEQMAKARSQNTYHSGGSGKKAGARNHSDNKEPRAAAPKRKAQSQVVQDYEQERKKRQVSRSIQGDEVNRSSQGAGREGHAFSQLVASQNRNFQAPSSSRSTPRASTQPSRMQTLAVATTASSTRQKRNTTRRLSKNEEMNARFARELNAAR